MKSVLAGLTDLGCLNNILGLQFISLGTRFLKFQWFH